MAEGINTGNTNKDYRAEYRKDLNDMADIISRFQKSDSTINIDHLVKALDKNIRSNKDFTDSLKQLFEKYNDAITVGKQKGIDTEGYLQREHNSLSLDLRKLFKNSFYAKNEEVTVRGGSQKFGSELAEKLLEGYYKSSNRDLTIISQNINEMNNKVGIIAGSVQQLESSTNNTVSLLVAIADGLHTTQVQQQVELSNLNNNLGQSNLLLQNIQSAQSQVQANLQAVQQQMLSNQQAMNQHFNTLVNTIQQNGVQSTQQQQEESNKEKQSQKSFLSMLMPQLGKLLKHSPILDLLKWGFLLLGDKFPVVGAMGILGAPLIAGGVTRGITKGLSNLAKGKGFFGGAFDGFRRSMSELWHNRGISGAVASQRYSIAERILNNPNASNALKARAQVIADRYRVGHQMYTNPGAPRVNAQNLLNNFRTNPWRTTGRIVSEPFRWLNPMHATNRVVQGANFLGTTFRSGGIERLTSGTSSLKAVSNVMKGSGILSAGLAILGDIPKLIKAKKEGQFANQMTQTTGGAVGAGLGTVLGGAVGSLLGPIGTIVGSALGAWVGQFFGRWFGQGLGPHVQKLMDSFGRLGNALAPFGSALATLASTLWNFVKPAFEWVGNAVRTLFEGIGNAFGSIIDNTTNFINFLATGLEKLANSKLMKKILQLGSAKDTEDDKEDAKENQNTSTDTKKDNKSNVLPKTVRTRKDSQGNITHVNGIRTVDMNKLGLHGDISGGNSVPFIAQQNAGRLKELDDLLKSWNVDFEYTSAMGGKHAGGARSHGAGAKVDLVLKKGGRLTKQQEQELIRRGFYGGATGAVGYHDAGSGYHYDLSVLDKNKAGSTRIASAGSVVTEGNNANVATTSSEVYSKVMDRTGGADTKDKQATIRNLVFSATDVTGSLGVWGITHNNNTGRPKGA